MSRRFGWVARVARVSRLASVVATFLGAAPALADPNLSLSLSNGGSGGVATNLQIVLLITILSLVPAILLMFTSFARIVVVLSFLRQAMSTPQLPPNQVLLSLALFLTQTSLGLSGLWAASLTSIVVVTCATAAWYATGRWKTRRLVTRAASEEAAAPAR